MSDRARLIDDAIEAVRRNPVPALVAAAGLGWLYLQMRRRPAAYARHAEMLEEESVPVLNIGQARIYDPDAPSRHPTQDFENRRELGVRA